MIDGRFGLAGKVAAVIGGAGHLCSTLARAMAESGMRVVSLDVGGPAAAEVPYLHCDVTSKEARKSSPPDGEFYVHLPYSDDNDRDAIAEYR